ncbi:hypothetical protein [Paraburkholderia lycopersici]|nr:hypothetical protein [Paraburkholderia lycopersici]
MAYQLDTMFERRALLMGAWTSIEAGMAADRIVSSVSWVSLAH